VTGREEDARQCRDLVLWQLPAWRLVDQDAHAFGSHELAGKVTSPTSLFTACVASCPR